ncbi:glucose-6-phosphate isomerase, partial [Candidatus Beckwithbacteria bacterium]|nr:glucose-6-phosphate isomerase [Candidatus Beckwithbacteria bacterium]
DPQQYHQLLRYIDPKKCVVNVISKSGSTTETAAAYAFFKTYFSEKLGQDWTKHFVFTTDQKEGILRAEADKLGIITLPVPDDVGGRFSVLSAVGLFPALAMGINVTELLTGAKQLVDNLSKDPNQNPAWQIALSQYLFQKEKGINTVVLMPYIWRMELFANWFRQLWAESLGKEGRGVLPIKAVGPADQHSQVQFYNQGKWLNTFLFITAKNYQHDSEISISDTPELAYLDKTKLSTIIKAECEATRYSLANNDRPSACIEIEQLDTKHLGALILFFELSVVYFGALLEINPFDQPGVEFGKQYMYGLLGRKGFEDKAKEIEKKKQSISKNVINFSF